MIRILELFGGIGACSKALERIGIEYEIADYVEIDKYAVASFNAMHNTNFEPQDICNWNKDIEVDLIMHGSPCQDFSLAGKQAGGDKDSGTRSSLMYETLRIVENLKPKYVIWENVKNVISKKHKHNYDNYCLKMSELGYMNYGKVLNAKNYGIPQNRERIFTISIRKDLNQTFDFPQPIELELKLKDMLEDEVDEKYYLSDKMINYIIADNEKWTGNNKESLINKTIASTINTGEDSKRCDASNYVSNEYGENYNLKIKNNTKKGYLEATDGDGIDISSRMEHHRGNVQKDKIQTITTSGGNDRGVVILGNYSPSKHNASMKVYCDMLKKTTNLKKCEQVGYIEKGTGQHQSNTIYNSENISPCLNASDYKEPVKIMINNKLRIRKLTPKECWRLMGFDDEDFEKANKVCSNTQLYKQAGNSIVVNVLEAILTNLLKGE